MVLSWLFYWISPSCLGFLQESSFHGYWHWSLDMTIAWFSGSFVLWWRALLRFRSLFFYCCVDCLVLFVLCVERGSVCKCSSEALFSSLPEGVKNRSAGQFVAGISQSYSCCVGRRRRPSLIHDDLELALHCVVSWEVYVLSQQSMTVSTSGIESRV